jgi:hypothetical protein
MGQIILDKPSGGYFKTDSPSGAFIDKETQGQIYYETRTINAGEPMGLLLSLTYPNTFSFIAPRP